MTRPTETARTRANALAAVVDARVSGLQRGYLAGTMVAQANLARLRRALGQPAGAAPDVWELTIAGLEEVEAPPPDGSPSRAENATHVAMTLYALNQRSASTPMHIGSTGLGRACAQLRLASHFNEEAVVRCFATLATAEGIDELTYHLRSMVGQFATESIGLDYGRLAHDLYLFQFEAYAGSVRLDWAREFHRIREHAADSGAADSGAADETSTPVPDATDKAGTHA